MSSYRKSTAFWRAFHLWSVFGWEFFFPLNLPISRVCWVRVSLCRFSINEVIRADEGLITRIEVLTSFLYHSDPLMAFQRILAATFSWHTVPFQSSNMAFLMIFSGSLCLLVQPCTQHTLFPVITSILWLSLTSYVTCMT